MDEKDLWLEAHRLLSQAVLVANEAVDAARAQRRYWMEEICANVTADGTLISTSGWKIPTAPKKMVTKKPRIRQEPTAKKPTIVRRKKKDDPNSEPPKKKFKLKMTAAPPPPPNDEEDEEDEDAYQQSSRPPSWEHGYGHHHAVPPGFHRHGGYYTPAQMVSETWWIECIFAAWLLSIFVHAYVDVQLHCSMSTVVWSPSAAPYVFSPS
jgi:hypothetical protein